ncbi:MAG TPA: dihydropteroate synthase [Polyangiaceae bacterium]|nr:dihydropteroate synthase [Polyangiaceae bacterium]
MGVLNVTPDSFSDGGQYLSADASKRRVDELLEQGADIVDIGGESTRPGSSPVSPTEQIERIRHPLIHAARERRAVVSVDTTSPAVARYALAEGASIINDVSCLADPELGRVVAEAGGALVIMHARGSMSAMRGYSDAAGNAYGDVVADVAREWRAARERAVESGVPAGEIVFDPGLGYMKNAAHSLELLRRLGEFAALGAPVLVGPSRKSFIAKATGSEAAPRERLGGTIAACLAAADGGANILRVHDVAEVKQALAMRRALGEAHA